MTDVDSCVVIDPPHAGDAEALATLFLEDMTSLRVHRTFDELLRLANDVLADLASESPSCWCWVARIEPGGPAVGVILANYHWSLKFAGKALWIEELYVTPSARRRGIGRLLVEYLLDRAEEAEIVGVDLEAYQGNTPASVLYRALGFHRLGRERFYYKLGPDEFL